jgi:hypothetical protein
MNISVMPLEYIVRFASQSSENSFCRHFTNSNILLCRELALTYYLELILDDAFYSEQHFASLILHHTQSGEHVEITNSGMYDKEQCLEGLKRELELLWMEGINAPIIAHDRKHPNFVTILNTSDRRMQSTDTNLIYMLAADYSVFLRGKRQRLMIA